MSFKLDFSGYKIILPLIENAKISCSPSRDITESIKGNKAMSGVFEFMSDDYGVSADLLLTGIHNAFSKTGDNRTTSDRSLSRLEQTYNWCRENWDLVIATVNFLQQTELETFGKKMCAEYLPNNIAFPDLTVYFVFDGCDGRGFKSIIYMDITLCAILGKEKCIGLIAHEYHHSCRAEFALQCSKPKWSNIFETIFHLESEGVADKIYNLGGDMPNNNFAPLRQLIRQRRKIYENAHVNLATVEKGILANANPREIFSQSSYHPLGNYMADLIERRFGKSRLIDCVGDPLQFLEIYNEAARLEKRENVNTFVFSDILMDILKQIKNDLYKQSF